MSAQPEAFLGVIQLNTSFPRIPGDVACAETFSFPVRFKVVERAHVRDIVRLQPPDEEVVAAFVGAARELEQAGAVALVTSCGFLSVLQEALSDAVKIPVIASALSLYPLLKSSLGIKPVGIVTADKASLSRKALIAAGVPVDVPAIGLEHSDAFRQMILESGQKGFTRAHFAQVEWDLTEACRELTKQYSLGGILFECTNLQPYAEQVRAQCRVPVFSIVHAAHLLWLGRRGIPGFHQPQ